MKAATHSRVYRGKKVLVKLADGTKFVDKFVDRTRATIVFEGRRVAREDIKSMTIYRAPSFTWVEFSHFSVDLEFAAEFPNQCPLRQVYDGAALCGQPLNGQGECPEHGKVRLRPREKLEDEEKKSEPYLSHYRRPTTARGKILSRRRRNFLSKVSV